MSDECPGHNLIKAPRTLRGRKNERRFCWTKLEEVVLLVFGPQLIFAFGLNFKLIIVNQNLLTYQVRQKNV